MSEALLQEALDTIAAERGRLDRSFDLAGQLLKAYGEAELAQRLYDAIPQDRPWRDVADLLGILEWDTSDEGSAIRRTAERWLRSGEDVRQVQVALSLDFYPFAQYEDMEEVLCRLAGRYPEIAPRCRDMIESRRRSR